jgi:acyl-coenzyme A synthetase/AMP-(fatty) acid ligase
VFGLGWLVSHGYFCYFVRLLIKFLGDIVFFDEDRYFYVVDRIKNVIKINGMQVSPLELVVFGIFFEKSLN